MGAKRFSFAPQVEAFCKNVPLEDFLRFKWPQPNFPPELVELFPLFLVFYRQKPGKARKLNKGYQSYIDEKGKSRRRKKTGDFKKAKTKDQNNFSVYVHYAHGIGMLGTIQRVVKHKGHGVLVAAYQPTEQERIYRENDSRLSHRKFKNFNQLYLLRKVYDPVFLELTDCLEREFPCAATGQTRLF